MRVFRYFLALMTLFATDFAHGSQSSTGTLISGKTTSSPVQSSEGFSHADRAKEEELFSKSSTFDQDIVTARAVMDCVVEKKPIVAVNYLNAFMEGRDAGSINAYLPSLEVCLWEIGKSQGKEGLSLRISRYTNYSLLAEAYLRKYSIPQLKAVAIEEFLKDNEYYRAASPDYRLAACLAYTQPDASAKVVGSAIGSADEARAFAVLSPLVSACVPAGSKLSLNKTWLRLRLATSIYLRSPPKTPRSPTTVREGGGR